MDGSRSGWVTTATTKGTALKIAGIFMWIERPASGATLVGMACDSYRQNHYASSAVGAK